MKKKLAPVIKLREDRCVNCHVCVSVCPVKYSNWGTELVMHVNADTCIGCGACVSACTHGAREIVDDVAELFDALGQGEPVLVIVAPSIASNFPDSYRRINGWLRSLGVPAVFDVGFGAELTVQSYAEHLRTKKPPLLISQPCPAIVSFIELYVPELIPHLAPVGSPMDHTMRMIREFYPQWKDAKIAALAPCIAKRREFDAIGLGDYLVTFKHLRQYLDENGIDLADYPEVDYENPPAERGVLFPMPGGLLKTAARDIEDIEEKTRVIEGSNKVYDYLRNLPHVLKNGRNPLLVDCLSCEFGCNSGPGSLTEKQPPDDLEWFLQRRGVSQKKIYEAKKTSGDEDPLRKTLLEFWKPDLYRRTYENLSGNTDLKMPTEEEIQAIYRDRLAKTSERDETNCGSCGYSTCREMAVGIFNGLMGNDHCYVAQQKFLVDRERTLAERESLLDGILDVSSEGYVAFSHHLNVVTHANDRFLEIWGLTREETVGLHTKKLHEILCDKMKDAALFQAALRDFIATLQPRNGVSELKDGRKIFWQCRAAHINEEDVVRVWSYRDITDQETAINTLRHNEQLLRDIFANLHAGIYLIDRDMNVVRCNEATETHFSRTSGPLVGKKCYSRENRTALCSQCLVRTVFETGQYVEDLILRPPNDGETGAGQWVERSAHPMLDESTGEITMVLCILRDVTQRRAQEEQLEQYRDHLEQLVQRRTEELSLAKEAAEAGSRAKSDFLANMSHEIRTPLTGVIGLSDLLLRSELQPKQQHFVNLVRSSGESLLFLINDILDFSKIEAGKLELVHEPFDLHDVIDSAMGILASRARPKNLEICYTTDDEPTPRIVRGDGNRLRQVLLNILGNAIKFTEHGGVRIRTKILETHGDRIKVHFDLIDTGIGIAEESMPRLFRDFSQAESSTSRTHGGTGLGLAISKRLVHLMGGDIGAESEVGVGTRFWFNIWLERMDESTNEANPVAAQRDRRALQYRHSLTDKRALIVDDNPVQLESFRDQFETWGMETLICRTADEAIAILNREFETGTPVDIVLVDNSIASSGSQRSGLGIDLIHEIEGRPEFERLIVLLTLALDEVAEYTYQNDSTRYSFLPKPVSCSALFDAAISAFFEIDPDLQSGIRLPEDTATGSADQTAEAVKLLRDRIDRPLRVLVAEDNRVNQIVVAGVLSEVGLEHLVAQNGKEAFDAVRESPFDLVLMDCQMPKVDGYEATRMIRDWEKKTKRKRVPIIALTANAVSGDEQKCLDAGMDAYCSKPINPGRLMGIIVQWLIASLSE